MHSATCLCGDVAWEADGELVFMHDCHCSRCRKTHGTPFATYVGVPADRFRITRGAERIVGWEPVPGARRNFCGRCGSVVALPPMGGQVFFPAGNLEGDPGVRRTFHIFVASKAPWYAITDGLPQNPGEPGSG